MTNGLLTIEQRDELRRRFAGIINEMSLENLSDTPDFVLASYLVTAFENFNLVTKARTAWYGAAK
jgi:hypothetical protein